MGSIRHIYAMSQTGPVFEGRPDEMKNTATNQDQTQKQPDICNNRKQKKIEKVDLFQ